MPGYRLSNRAANDLDRLYEYGIERFGIEQADHYYDGLIVRLQNISGNPRHAPAVEHIYPGLRRAVYHSHSIYYLIAVYGVRIVRILGREDAARALP